MTAWQTVEKPMRPLDWGLSGEAATHDSLGLSERPASAGSAALGNGKLMSLALKAREIRGAAFNLVPQENITVAFEPRLQR